eukprot:1661226-Amphidinium_carterae.2
MSSRPSIGTSNEFKTSSVGMNNEFKTSSVGTSNEFTAADVSDEYKISGVAVGARTLCRASTPVLQSMAHGGADLVPRLHGHMR